MHYNSETECTFNNGGYLKYNIYLKYVFKHFYFIESILYFVFEYFLENILYLNKIF